MEIPLLTVDMTIRMICRKHEVEILESKDIQRYRYVYSLVYVPPMSNELRKDWDWLKSLIKLVDGIGPFGLEATEVVRLNNAL